MDYTIFDGGKRILPNDEADAQHQLLQIENQEQNNQSTMNNGVKIEDEDDSSSCVIDLVTNPKINSTVKVNTKQPTTECSASGNNNNIMKNINSEVTIHRTGSLSSSLHSSEQIVIKTEQDETKDDFDNCLEIKNRISSSLSDSLAGGLESKDAPTASRTNSQGINLDASDSGTDWQSSNAVTNETLNALLLVNRRRDALAAEGDVFQQSPAIADNQLYAEMFGDWSHFRPKTPDDELPFDSMPLDDLPLFAENSLLSVEIQRLADVERKAPAVRLDAPAAEDEITSTSSQAVSSTTNNRFLASPFSLENVLAMERASAPHTHNASALTDADPSKSDSLPELSLSLGENQSNDKVLDNLLEECGIDVSKGFNPSTNFWNGVLDESSTIFDVIDDKKLEEGGDEAARLTQSRLAQRRKLLHRHQRVGHSLFSVSNLHQGEKIFREADPNEVAPKTSASTLTTDANTVTTTTANIVDSTTAVSAIPRGVVEVKKELLDAGSDDASGLSSNALNSIGGGRVIKLEPSDEMPTTSTVDDHMPHAKPQILPVIKTEVVNSLPVTNATIQRSVTMQAAQLQPAQVQSSLPGDQTFVLSSRPIRRFTTTNGPTDGKSGKSLAAPFPHCNPLKAISPRSRARAPFRRCPAFAVQS